MLIAGLVITIFIDGKPYEVEEGQNLLRIALSLGLDLPYFCWHPALHSVGACRQCAIKQFRNEEDTRGRIVMACMTPATPGMRLSINDPEVRQFRSHIIEFLMINHPHDCPVCDEGGECHLQDMTVMTGHAKRQYRFLKRTHQNQYLGPFIAHEMNRCIACYRCVRFYRNYAGGRDLDVFGAHDHVYFGRQSDGVLESEFSGNLVEVCPTGVFTDKTLQRHYTRKWDLQTAPSVCVHCSVGCNTFAGERYGLLRRIYNRFNPEVNRYFLCDRGRFGYEFVNSPKRIAQPCISGKLAKPEEAMELIKSWFKGAKRMIGVGSSRASLETNFALQQLVGKANFYHGVNVMEGRMTALALELMRGSVPAASLREIEESDAALVLGEDVSNVAPMVALALRQTSRRQPTLEAQKLKIPSWHDSALREVIQEQRGPIFIAAMSGTRLDSIAQDVFYGATDDISCFGFAVAHYIDPQSPEPARCAGSFLQRAENVAKALLASAVPVIVTGTSSRDMDILHAAVNVALALRRKGRPARICVTLPECNSMGLALLEGGTLSQAFKDAAQEPFDVGIIVERDLYRCADARDVSQFLSSIKHLVVLDHVEHWTTEKAEVVLPAATFAESTGTLVNYESRAQRFYEVGTCGTHDGTRGLPEIQRRSSWRWLGEMQGAAWKNEDEITQALIQANPEFSVLKDIAPPADFRVAESKLPRQPHRYSGRTAMFAHKTVHEPPVRPDPDSALAFTMEGPQLPPQEPLAARNWQPGWNSVQALYKNAPHADVPGIAGKRIVQAREGNAGDYFTPPTKPFIKRAGEWLVVPLYHVFGSEILSMMAPGVAQLAPSPYMAVNADDAQALGLKENEMAVLSISGVAHPLPVRITPGIVQGLVGLPINLPGFSFVSLPVWARIDRQSRSPNSK